jgi:ADP-heptose:LPS heptosyltransferase
MDADDEVLTPLAIRRAKYMPSGAFGMWIELGGGVRQVHYRFWNAEARIRFKGWVHEYPVLPDGLPAPVLNDVCILHDATPHESAGETSNERNLRILLKQYAAEPDARCAFYLANTHKDGGRWREAAEWYHKRLGYGDAFRDEYLFSFLYLARCLFADGQEQPGRDACETALAVAPDWQEFRMELAQADYRAKDYDAAIQNALLAFDRPIPQTVLWREKDKYTDQPARLISWCHQHQNRIVNALTWSEIAANRIGQPDAQWQARHRQLIGMRDAERNKPAAPAIVTRRQERIALVRPGAIGDVLMTLNLIPAFREANPDAFISYYTSPSIGGPDALLPYMLQAGVDVVMDVASVDKWKHDRRIDLVGYPLAEGYPDKPMRSHLLDYFAFELGLCNEFELMCDVVRLPPSQGLPALELPLPKRPWFCPNEDYVTLQMTAGWSKYKEWSEAKWLAFMKAAWLFAECPPIVIIEQQVNRSLGDSVAAIANARMHLGIDSFGNHLTNYFWKDGNHARRVPGVILWGSTQMEAAGYPTNINIGHRLPCGPCFKENPAISRMPRGLCVDPPGQTRHDEGVHACMASITVDEVVEAALKVWNNAT